MNATPPIRTCAGCRETRPQGELVRLAVVEEPPYLVPDARKKLGGRGVWVMPSRACLQKAARKGGFSRALRKNVNVDPTQIAELLVAQLTKRLDGLALGAKRGGHLAIGAEAVKESLQAGRACALWVAQDAGRREFYLSRASELGVAFVHADDRANLGRRLGREEVAVVAIEDQGLADEIARVSAQLSGLSESELTGSTTR